MTNPVDEYLEEKQKTAGPMGSFMRAAGASLKDTITNPQQLGAALGVGALGLGLDFGARAVSKAYGAMTKRHDFKEMLAANPDLEEHHEGSPEQFNRYYTTLRSLAPHYASDPIISGAVMRKMTLYPQNAGYTALELIGRHAPQQPGALRTGSDFVGAGDRVLGARRQEDQHLRGLARDEQQADMHTLALEQKRLQLEQMKRRASEGDQHTHELPQY